MGAIGYLMDTHTFLWAVRGSSKLSDTALTALEDANTAKYISSVSAFEIMNKYRIGKFVVMKGQATVSTDYINAYTFSSNHRALLMKDNLCGCFYCIKIFSPSEISDWVEDIDGTAICPYCWIDSIIGEHSGYPITEEFLSGMQEHYF